MIFIHRPAFLILIAISVVATAQEPTLERKETDGGKHETVSTGAIPFFGVQLHTLQWEPEKHRRAVDLMVEAGIQIGRDECHWSHVEKNKGELVIPPDFFTNLDYTIAQGREILLLLNYSNPHYDNGKPPTSPEGIAAYARYCRKMVEATKGRIKYFEIWNEPNAEGFWPPRPDPRAYAKLLMAASAAIREANPEAVILAPATSGYAEDFLREMLKEPGVWESFDVLSFHPYCHPASPEAAQKFEQLDALMEELKAQGAPKPVWITEFGYHTADMGGVTEREQAAYLARFYLLAMTRPYITGVVWYWLGPDGPNPDWGEDRFGLVREDYSYKPSFIAYNRLIRELKGSQFVKYASTNPFLVKFHFDDREVMAGWTLKDKAGVNLHASNHILQTIFISNRETLEVGLPYQGENKLTSIIYDHPVIFSSQGEFLSHEFEKEGLIDVTAERIIARGETKEFQFINNSSVRACGLRVLFLGISGNMPAMLFGNSIYNLQPKDQTNAYIDLISDSSFRIYCPPDYQYDEFDVEVCMTMEEIRPLIQGYDLLTFSVIDPIGILFTPVYTINNQLGIDINAINNTSENLSADIQLDTDDVFKFTPSTLADIDLMGNQDKVIHCLIGDDHLFDRSHILNIHYKLISSNGFMSRGSSLMSFARADHKKSLTIDGDLSDWKPAGDPIRIGERWQVTGEFRPWRGTKDSNARVWTAWNDEWFYFAAEFEDDKFCAEFDGWQVYRNDGFELYFDIDHDGDRAVKSYNEDDFQWGVFPTKSGPVVWRWSHYNSASPGARFVFNPAPKREQTISGTEFTGYIYEAALPMSELKWKPCAGQHIGFNVAFTDADDPEFVHPFGQEVQMSWSGRPSNHLTPHSFADLFLAGPGTESLPE